MSESDAVTVEIYLNTPEEGQGVQMTMREFDNLTDQWRAEGRTVGEMLAWKPVLGSRTWCRNS